MKFFKLNLILLCGSILFLSGCFSKGNSDLLPKNEGVITGTILEQGTDSVLDEVQVALDYQGKSYSVKTESNGCFTLNVGLVERNSGISLTFSKVGYATVTKAAVFDLINGRIELGNIYLPKGTVDNVKRKITGYIKDDFSHNPLVGASIKVVNSQRETLSALTDSNGFFTIEGTSLYLNSSYNLIVSADKFCENSNTIVTITGAENRLNDIHLMRKAGKLTGFIFDQQSNVSLAGATIQTTDSNSQAVSTISRDDGSFLLTSDALYTEQTYNITVSKAGYLSQSLNYQIAQAGEQSIGNFVMKKEISLNGRLVNAENSPLADIQVKLFAGEIELATVQSSADGQFTFTNQNLNLEIGRTYHAKIAGNSHTLSLREVSFNSIVAGNNNLGDLTILPIPSEGIKITGNVLDYWYHSELNQNKGVNATVTIIDDEGSRSAECNENGEFSLTAKVFAHETYLLKIKADGYTGGYNQTNSSLLEQEVTIASQTSDFALENVYLYPVGIRFTENGQPREFSAHLQQNRAKFLTGKIGLTIFARNEENLDTADSFYLHVDEKDARALPTIIPENYKSSLAVINGATVRGAIAAGYAAEQQNRPTRQKPASFNIKTDSGVMFHFYVANPGQVNVTVAGISNVVNVFATDGSALTSGSDSLSFNVTNPGWYFVKVKGATDRTWGFFNLTITGPAQEADALANVSFSTNDLVISYYKNSNKKLYIAGEGEHNSTGQITVVSMGTTGKLIYGTFNGNLKSIEQSSVATVIAHGYFNVVRGE